MLILLTTIRNKGKSNSYVNTVDDYKELFLPFKGKNSYVNTVDDYKK